MKRIVVELICLTFAAVGALWLWSGQEPGPRPSRPVPELVSPPAGVDLTTYNNAKRLVEMTKGFMAMEQEVKALREELTASNHTED